MYVQLADASFFGHELVRLVCQKKQSNFTGSVSDDRRRYPRADLVFSLTYSLEEAQVETLSRDLSGDGVSFLCKTLVPLGTKIAISFGLEGVPGEIRATGRVVRSWEEGGSHFAAMHFTEIDEVERLIVLDYSLSASDEAARQKNA